MTPAPHVIWSPVDLKLTYTCVLHESRVVTSCTRPESVLALSTATSRKIPSFRRFRAVSSAVAESYGAPSGISSSRRTTCSRVTMCSAFAIWRHPERVLAWSNTFSR